MLGLELNVPAIARRRRPDGATPPPVFPAHAYAYWEGQGQSNMTGFNQISDAPASLRVVNPDIEVLTAGGAWAPYALLDTGESQVVEGVTFTGKLDEVEIPQAAGGAGPMIGLHEAMIAGDMNDAGGLIPAGLLHAKFSAAGQLLDAFLPDYDDGSAPLGGANFNARNNELPTALRARLTEGQTIFAQGKIWMHGEANAGAARTAGSVSAPEIVNYAADFARIRDFDRTQIGAPSLPYYLCAIYEADIYDQAINAQLESLCRWRVEQDGTVVDLGATRDATSYFINHGIDTAGDVHFDMGEIRAIGALVWGAHQHLTGLVEGLTEAHRISAIAPVHQRDPAITTTGEHEISIDAVINEDSVLYGLIQPAGSPAPSAATIVMSGQSSVAAEKGRAAELSFIGLNAETDYEIWLVASVASGEQTALKTVSATTDAATPQQGWTPATAGALIWFDAQDAASVTEAAGEVTNWSDKSPNGANLAPLAGNSQPVRLAAGLNGFPALDFDGDDDMEASLASGALAADMCLLIVAEVDVVTNGSEALIDFQTQNLKVRASNTAEFRARFELQNGANTNLTPSPTTNFAGAPHLFLGRYDSASATVEIWIDGALGATGSTYTVPISGPDTLRLMRPFGSALKLDGKIGEVVAINSSATADRERLEGYAAHRWGLTGLLPAGHPYKTTAP